MEKIYRLRAHHGMCIHYFKGKGYSQEFTYHMGKLVEALGDDPDVQIVAETDEVCEKCPGNCGGICQTEEKVSRYDGEVLRMCGLEVGTVMPYSQLRERVLDCIIYRGKRESICGDCQWSEICVE